MDLNIGRKLDGRYEITELIGIGGMAHVYKAIDLMENKVVAVKILKMEFAESEEFLRRFRNESKAIAVLSHPNIVKIFDVGFSDEINFIVMEYIDGITLKEFMEQQQVLRWKDALHFITQILRALQHAHDRGIVHRDIKPQNIMLFSDGSIKVMDFGIARFSRIDGKTISDKTIGSVHYISPEQAKGDFTDERSDLYSVGVMLYEMLTGQKPFDGDNPVAVALMHMQDTPTYPRDVNPSIPMALEEIILHAMEKNPAKRYQSASEMIKDIDMFKIDQSIVFGYNSSDEEEEDEPTRYFDPVKNSYDDEDDEDYDDDDEYDDDDGEDEKKRSYVVPILASVSVAVVIIAAIVIAFIVSKISNNSAGDDRVQVPQFINMEISQVREQYGDIFQIQTNEENNNDYAEGIVFKQGTEQGTSVKKGTTIILTVSKGPRMQSIPDVVNLEYDEAVAQLTKYGFDPVRVTQPDDEIMEGYVISTEPSASEEAPYGSKINVIVCSGPLENNVPVPKLLGLTEEDAIKALTEYKLGYEKYDVNTLEDKGKVVSQSIAEGEFVAKGTVVKIGVSTGTELESTVSINMPIPAGAEGKFRVELYEGGTLRNSQTIDKAELVAGDSVSLSVSGTGSKVYKILVVNAATEQSVQYAQYTVDFNAKTVKEDSIDKDAFISLVITTTTTTEPPVTTTEPPVTDPPATEPPATEPPATEPPATEPPVTEPPATEAPEGPASDPSQNEQPAE